MKRHQNADIDYNKIKRTLQRDKRGILPKNPTTVEDIIAAFDDPAVLETYGRSADKNEPFKFYDGVIRTNKYSFCVFSSKKTIDIMNEHIPINVREIFMDATFGIVPVGPFKQLLIIYVRMHKKVTHSLMLLLYFVNFFG